MIKVTIDTKKHKEVRHDVLFVKGVATMPDSHKRKADILKRYYGAKITVITDKVEEAADEDMVDPNDPDAVKVAAEKQAEQVRIDAEKQAEEEKQAKIEKAKVDQVKANQVKTDQAKVEPAKENKTK